jgi:hypothetical protein
MKAIQLLIPISGGFHNVYTDLRRGDVVDIDGVNLLESTARRYVALGYAIECPGKPLDVRDLPFGYKSPGG